MQNLGGRSDQSIGNVLLIPKDYRENHFNSLRFMMALLVVWSHAFALYFGSEDTEPISLILDGQYNAGNVAVRVFFIISGYLITISFLRTRSLPAYMRKRVARIYPGFIVAVMICAFVVVPLFSLHADLSMATAAQTVGLSFLLHPSFPASDVFAANPGQAVNGALWSISFEFWCYLGLAALGLSKILRHRSAVLAIMLGIMAARAYLDVQGLKPSGGIIGDIVGWPYLWLSIAPCFLAGVLAYLYRDELPRSRALAVGFFAALILSAHLSDLLCDALFPIVTAYLTFYFAFSSSRIPDAAMFGDFSYGTYLYGFPIEQMLVGAALPFALYVPSAMILSVGAGVVSWFLIERRFLPRKLVVTRRDEWPLPISSFAAIRSD